MSSDLPKPPEPPSEQLELQDTEAQIRRALGLDRAQPKQDLPRQQSTLSPRRTRRFASDGEVPVVLVRREHDHGGSPRGLAQDGAPVNRLEAAEEALKAERSARELAQELESKAQVKIRDLQTKLAHAELAQGEAREAAEAAGAVMDRLRADLRDLQARLDTAEAARIAAETELAAERRARAPAKAVGMGGRPEPKASEAGTSEPRTASGRRPRLALAPAPAKRQAKPASAKTASEAAASRGPAKPKGRQPSGARKAGRESEPVKWWVKGWGGRKMKP